MAVNFSVFVAASVDGFIARKNGDIDWLDHDSSGDDYGYTEFLDSVDLLVMGRNTFQKVLSFGKWPYGKIRVIVLSRSLTGSDLPAKLKANVSISSLPPTELADSLGEGIQRVYVDGGKTIQSFLNNRLITDITISRFPILLGEGIPLFGKTESDISLILLESKSFPSGIVIERYEVAY